MGIRREHIIAWLDALQRVYAENRAWLTDLDSAIGDADHGTNMDRGFTTARVELEAAAPADIRGVLQCLATSLVRHVGGASGALYGTFFLRASTACAGKEELDAAAFVAMFQEGVKGIQHRGKAEPGDKTMFDALGPALTAMRRELEHHTALPAILQQGAAAAKAGMEATIPMQARKGRASYLGPRSVGHQDPGATSAWLLLEAAAGVFRQI
jgi:phosphoenolpyruvate---glycerone phosphotransferase subunit DhaL